jgi:hypothetical protein
MEKLSSVYWGFYAVMQLILTIGGIAIHAWTIGIAISLHGVVGGLISLVLPIVSELYYFFVLFIDTGTLFNSYGSSILIYVATIVVICILSGIFSSVETKNLD